MTTSGSHLNPAITIALWRLPASTQTSLFCYIIAQVARAFCATVLVYGLYCNLFSDSQQTHNIVCGSVRL
ncbi:MAG: aquaporin [Candidatus Malihini olakiniferum]